jgi:hypothetical protein
VCIISLLFDTCSLNVKLASFIRHTYLNTIHFLHITHFPSDYLLIRHTYLNTIHFLQIIFLYDTLTFRLSSYIFPYILPYTTHLPSVDIAPSYNTLPFRLSSYTLPYTIHLIHFIHLHYLHILKNVTLHI